LNERERAFGPEIRSVPGQEATAAAVTRSLPMQSNLKDLLLCKQGDMENTTIKLKHDCEIKQGISNKDEDV